jgi:lysophospholipase L1-like esterase
MGVNMSGATFIYKIAGGSIYVIGSATSLTTGTIALVNGHVISLAATVTGDGLTTSTITCQFYDVTAGNALLGTITYTDTTTAELVTGGRVGLSGLLSPGSPSPPAFLQYTKVVVYSDTAYTTPVVPFGLIGDSLEYGINVTRGPVGEIQARILTCRTGGAKRYMAINQGQGGSQTSDWLPTDGKGYLSNAIATLQALGAQIVQVNLGSNDARLSVTAATWLANMQTIINYVAAQMPGVPIIVNCPPFFDASRFIAAGNASALNTNAIIGTYIVAAASLTGCTVGDKYAYTAFQAYDFMWLSDGGHPNDQGAPQLAILRANAAFPANPSAGGAHLMRRF